MIRTHITSGSEIERPKTVGQTFRRNFMLFLRLLFKCLQLKLTKVFGRLAGVGDCPPGDKYFTAYYNVRPTYCSIFYDIFQKLIYTFRFIVRTQYNKRMPPYTR